MVRKIGNQILVAPGRRCDKCQRGPLYIVGDAHRTRQIVEITGDGTAHVLTWVRCQSCRAFYTKKIPYDTFTDRNS